MLSIGPLIAVDMQFFKGNMDGQYAAHPLEILDRLSGILLFVGWTFQVDERIRIIFTDQWMCKTCKWAFDFDSFSALPCSLPGNLRLALHVLKQTYL